jgi:hypothetical protein
MSNNNFLLIIIKFKLIKILKSKLLNSQIFFIKIWHNPAKLKESKKILLISLQIFIKVPTWKTSKTHFHLPKKKNKTYLFSIWKVLKKWIEKVVNKLKIKFLKQKIIKKKFFFTKYFFNKKKKVNFRKNESFNSDSNPLELK